MTTYRASDPKFLAYLVEQYGNCMSFPAVVKEIGASRCTLGRLAAAGELWVYTVGRSRVLRLRTAEVAALTAAGGMNCSVGLERLSWLQVPIQ